MTGFAGAGRGRVAAPEFTFERKGDIARAFRQSSLVVIDSGL